MKQISNKEYEKYQQYLTDQLHGRTLTPDGLRIICASFDHDPEKNFYSFRPRILLSLTPHPNI